MNICTHAMLSILNFMENEDKNSKSFQQKRVKEKSIKQNSDLQAAAGFSEDCPG